MRVLICHPHLMVKRNADGGVIVGVSGPESYHIVLVEAVRSAAQSNVVRVDHISQNMNKRAL